MERVMQWTVPPDDVGGEVVNDSDLDRRISELQADYRMRPREKWETEFVGSVMKFVVEPRLTGVQAEFELGKIMDAYELDSPAWSTDPLRNLPAPTYDDWIKLERPGPSFSDWWDDHPEVRWRLTALLWLGVVFLLVWLL